MESAYFINEYQNYKPALYNFAKKLTKNINEAEDLVQETAIKAYKGFHTFKAGTSFKSWAFTILKNTFINKYNKKKRRAVVNAPIEDFTYAYESKHSIHNNAVSKLKIKEIRKSIYRLSEKSKVPFIMHTQGYQYKEIAEHLDIPIGTVKSRINFARTKLKKYLKEKDIGPK